MDHSILYSFFFFENHRKLRWYRCCGCCFILVWCTDVKSSDLIITLSPNNFTTFQKGIRTRTHIDINNKYLQIFASIKCSHMNITVCVWRKKWKLLVIEKWKKKLVGMVLQHCLCVGHSYMYRESESETYQSDRMAKVQPYIHQRVVNTHIGWFSTSLFSFSFLFSENNLI